jgi:hypothetical protein
MTNENTCDAANVYFTSNYLYSKYNTFSFWPFYEPKKSFNDDILAKDLGSSKCENEPFSDFAV